MLFAASRMVVPAGTSISWPSIDSDTRAAGDGLSICTPRSPFAIVMSSEAGWFAGIVEMLPHRQHDNDWPMNSKLTRCHVERSETSPRETLNYGDCTARCFPTVSMTGLLHCESLSC